MSSTLSSNTVQRPVSRGAAPRGWAFFIPGLSIVVFMLVITLPWGFGPATIYVPSFLILTLIVSWTVRHPRLIPSFLVFLVGVAVDVVTASPVGYWAFLFLVGYACALHISRWEFEWLTVATLVALIPITFLAGGLGWLLTSAYFAQVANWQPVYDSLLVTWFVCPVVAVLTRWCSDWMSGHDRGAGNGGSSS